MKKIISLWLIIAFVTLCFGCEKEKDILDDIDYIYPEVYALTSQYMNEFEPYKDGRWCYEDGIILQGSQYMYKATNETYFNDFVVDYLDTSLAIDGTPERYKLEDYSTDNVNSGKVLFEYYEQDDTRYLDAIELMKLQLDNHPRTNAGNFWHKLKYTNQVWLDGLYMALPFLAKYIREIEDEQDYSDVINQFENVHELLWDDERELYIHAYDEAKIMNWADEETGKSANVWSRSVGWYAMALIDVLEIAKDNDDVQNALIPIFEELVEGLIQYQDNNGMWYQIIDGEEIGGNYHETSGTLMLAYAYIKGVRLGYLDENYFDLGVKAFEGTLDEYLVRTNNYFELGGTCRSAGLDNDLRNGSVAYYLSEPIVINEAKGIAPLMMTYSELLKLEQN